MKSAVTVAVENTAYHFDIPYTYLLPEDIAAKAVPGCRVMGSGAHSPASKFSSDKRVMTEPHNKRN